MATKEMSKLVIDNEEFEVVDAKARQDIANDCVPKTRKVNNKALSSNITLSASDVGAAASGHTHTAADVGAVPTTRKVNSKALSLDITLSASDVSAVPTTRKVNSKELSSDISLTASDVGASERAIGSVIWFSGNTGKVPTGYLVCNGQAVSRTAYANLFAVIGTKYGTGDGSTTFNLPDLSDGNGRFIRAGFTDSAIGSKQSDAIRNITGTVTPHTGNQYVYMAWTGGAFSSTESGASEINASPSPSLTHGLNFNANNGNQPMAGHANGNDIHPYNIAFLPLIAY